MSKNTICIRIVAFLGIYCPVSAIAGYEAASRGCPILAVALGICCGIGLVIGVAWFLALGEEV